MRTIVLAATFALALALQADAQTSTTPAPTTAHKKVVKPRHHTPAAPSAVTAVAPPAAPIASAIVPTPYAQNPIQQLRGSSRAILIFAPDTTNPALLTQFALLERNELALTERDAILVPNITLHHATDESFPGENISPGSDGDQLSARLKFGIKPADFTIIVLERDGTEKFRSNTPITVANIGDRLDGVRNPGE